MAFTEVSIVSCTIIRILFLNYYRTTVISITIMHFVQKTQNPPSNALYGVPLATVSIVSLRPSSYPLYSKSATGSTLKIWELTPSALPHDSTASGQVKFFTSLVNLASPIFCTKGASQPPFTGIFPFVFLSKIGIVLD